MENTARRSLNDVRIGFVISHPFHFFIYRPLIRALKNPVAIIEKRKNTPFEFSKQFFLDLGCEFVILDEKELGVVDQQVDVVFVMTPKHLAANFKNAKPVVMQYGMAKEAYNYGLWRCRGALNMMYGPYSTAAITGHAVARSVGNTRLDGYVPPRIGGGGLLYLPTYGDLSTLSRFASLLPTLNTDVPIKIKLHHASEFEDARIVAQLKDDPRITLLDGYRDALDDIAGADVVLSDYSGAIFDALFLQRPIALFQPGYTQKVARTNDNSIEIARGSDFGEVLSTDAELVDFFDRLAAGAQPHPPRVERSEFLSNPGNAVPVALDLLEQLVNEEIARNVVQESIFSTYSQLIARPTKPVVIGPRTALKRWLAAKVFKQ